jgi:hypothetical protein
MDNTTERSLGYCLATPIQESQIDHVSGGGDVSMGKWPHIVVTGNSSSPDVVIEY